MNVQTFKALLIRDKQFLRQLFTGANVFKNKRILMSATDNELDTLLKYLYCVVNGQILINQSNFDEIKRQKKLSFIQKHLENKETFIDFLNNSRLNKINFIIKLSPILPNLLFGLFNLEPQLHKQENGV